MRFVLTSCLWLFLLAAAAHSASSQWFRHEGAAARVVIAGVPDRAGRLRGVIDIVLEPGWKTYWRDPGKYGVPPAIDLSFPSGAAGEILFPAPAYIVEDYGTWAGYTDSLALPVIFQLAPGETTDVVAGTVFLGVCENICIPVQADFRIQPATGIDDRAQERLVDAAFAALPDAAQSGLKVVETHREATRLILEAEIPEGAAKVDLFLAAAPERQLSVPKLLRREGDSALFEAEIVGDNKHDGEWRLDYTLSADGKAVDGTLTLP